MKPAVSIVALCCSTTALFFTMWILVPAQLMVLWLVAVVSSEWSLHFGLLALAGVSMGFIAARKKKSWVTTVAIVAGLAAVVFSTYPTMVSLPLAKSNAVDLSWGRYYLGSPAALPSIQAFEYSRVDEVSLQLDVYQPGEAAATGRPAVVVVHGGSWSGGSRSDFPRWNTWLTPRGFVVFDIDYRLEPQPNWQTATADVQEAVRWIKARADSFGIDPQKMALMGRSAGGHLALLAAYTATESQMQQNRSLNATVQAVVAFYAPTDLQWGYRNPANPRVINGRQTLRSFVGGTPNYISEVYRQASPIHHVQMSTPATLLVHGRQDQLVRNQHSRRLIEVLQANSDPARHRALFIPYAQHGFDFNFNGWGAQVAQAVMLEHLNEFLNLN